MDLWSLVFWVVVVVGALIMCVILMGALNWCIAMAFGGAPIPHWWSCARHIGKRLCGFRPTHWEWSCPGGYLGYRLCYSDGSVVDFRSGSWFFKGVPNKEGK